MWRMRGDETGQAWGPPPGPSVTRQDIVGHWEGRVAVLRSLPVSPSSPRPAGPEVTGSALIVPEGPWVSALRGPPGHVWGPRLVWVLGSRAMFLSPEGSLPTLGSPRSPARSG